MESRFALSHALGVPGTPPLRETSEDEIACETRHRQCGMGHPYRKRRTKRHVG
jgi:hypothetical protein